MQNTLPHASSKLASISVIILAGIIIFPGLPLRFTLQPLAPGLLGSLSFVVALYALSNLIYGKASVTGTTQYPDIGWFEKYGIECLLCLMLAYFALQLIPLPGSILEWLSPSMAAIWQVDAYALDGKGTLTANISGTIWFLMTWCSYFLLFLLLSHLISKNWHFVLITLILFLSGLYQIVFDELSKYLGYEYITAAQTDGHTYRLTGTFVNSNNLSALLNLSIAAGLTLLVLLKYRIVRLNAAVLVVAFIFVGLGELILFYGLIKAGSAGGLLSLVVSVFLVCIFLILRQFSMKVVTGLFVFVVITLVILTFYGSRELNIVELRDNLSLSGRPDLWLSAIDMWKDFPLFGIGAGAFEWVFPMYKSDTVTPLRVFTAHSGYVHLAVEMGLAGVILSIVLVFLYFMKILGLLKKSQIHRYLTCSLMVGVFAFLVHECVETNLLIPPVAVLFFTVLALIMGITNLNLDTRQSN
jgi:O-antigen ligase